MKCSNNHLVSGDICNICDERIKPERVKPQGINKVSKKRSNELAEYTKLKKTFLLVNPMCAVFPRLRAIDIHHISGKLGSRFLDVNNFLAVSREGHNWIHENEAEATKLGFMISRLATNKEVI